MTILADDIVDISMWKFVNVSNPSGLALWFSDGHAIYSLRGGNGASSRLIVGGEGFLDITDFQTGYPNGPIIDVVDFNGLDFNYTPNAVSTYNLTLPGDGSFTVQSLLTGQSLSGKLKPLPNVSSSDASFLLQMFQEKFVPYQNIPDAPGKTTAQIKALGSKLFPFSDFSFELAMSVYDWTTASFMRMVLMKIFEYTAMNESPRPLDLSSIANAIWESNWPPYTPQNADYMRSFLMTTCTTLQDVQTQLSSVYLQLQAFSDVQNRLLAAAFLAMPRTSALAKPQLFSGQLDIQQLGLEHFGIEFLECPLNSGPVSNPLSMQFEKAITTFARPGNVITTKMVWSFGDSMSEAITYQNGLVIIANRPSGAWVWDAAAYITPLSDDPKKIEYAFAPNTPFLVQSIDQEEIQGKLVWVMNVQPQLAGNR